ncbi:UNVERIFIED_CONTAM: Major allergen Pru ar 1 [Sesamum latifolium]|uniref:Major allergen Pru ar 1 n=1 Tax=Sesamum latifolium TaxID=2727402 RepID=A0AAW2X867_9LAMI
MVAITYDMEIPSAIPAAKIFKALVLDAHTLIPKIVPQAIKSVEILEGDGGVGTVKLIHFGQGSQYKSVKHRVDAIDKENLTHSYTVVEGDALAGVLNQSLIM